MLLRVAAYGQGAGVGYEVGVGGCFSQRAGESERGEQKSRNQRLSPAGEEKKEGNAGP